ncbi:hypothetical protein NFI95_14950 [Acetobacteraceae bacterium KSS8]|uniref:DUF1828 domain-containing protein n=1 Tax=Endosaccharibacter trunci TaxID=2812733 RepID=A0ABT1WA30_9PROT|nr:hypothetical protein [Acetobacteraceae bacterium KSS8]
MKPMESHLVEFADDDELRQGDIIFKAGINGQESQWGFILNADCDIAQGKTKRSYTIVDIMSSEIYLEKVWAPAQLNKLIDRYSELPLEKISSVMRASSITERITPEILKGWILDVGPERFECQVNKTGSTFDQKTKSYLKALYTALKNDNSRNNMERLRLARQCIDASSQNFRRQIADAFGGEHGFPDFFFLPEVPRGSAFGSVVILRSIRALTASDLVLTETDARIAGRQEVFHRVGRLADGLRFAISQKLTFLFSRIGMPKKFEDSCKAAIELLAEQEGGDW